MTGETSMQDNYSNANNSDGNMTVSEKMTTKNSGSASVDMSSDSLQKFTHLNEDPEALSGEDLVNIVRTETNAERSLEVSRILTNAGSIREEVEKQEREGIPIPKMGGDRDYPPDLPDSSIYTVSFDGPDDPLHPHNWPFHKKAIQCVIIGFNTFCIAFGSAIFAEAITTLASIYHVNYVVTTLSVTLYVLGFATGPVIWAPISELYGRRPVLVLSSLAFCCFNFAVAVSDRLESILICRFFAGCLGAAPLVVVPASFADMFGNKTRGTAIILFSMAVFVGPMMAPFIGGFIVSRKSLGWRWTEFITGILAAASFVSIVLFETETHHPMILVAKAREIKRRTGNWGIHAPHDEFSLSIKEIVEKNLTRPIIMLFTEPILLFITIYNSFIYGMIYLFLTAYPIVFQDGYGMIPGVAELPYFGLIIGQFIGGSFCIWYETIYNKKLDANNGKIVPENRLLPMLVGGICFPIGLLWFCWTGNYPHKVHWIVPTISGLFTGFGTIAIFIPSMNYIIDAYLLFAASAMAGNTFLRSTFGAVFPLFAGFMFRNMGTNWAGLLLGLFAACLILCPLAFMKYGKKIRQKSKYAFDLS